MIWRRPSANSLYRRTEPEVMLNTLFAGSPSRAKTPSACTDSCSAMESKTAMSSGFRLAQTLKGRAPAGVAHRALASLQAFVRQGSDFQHHASRSLKA